jgi:hypothetical protein
MPAPYDYLSQLPGNAFENALKGYQENLKAQEAAANKKMMESDLAALAGNTSASVQDYNKLMLKYPALQEQLGNSWKMMEGNRRQGLMDYGSKGLFALENNDTNTAIKLTEDYANALANSGKPDEAAQIRAVGELIKYDPNAARTSFKLSMMAGMGAEKYAELEAKKAEAQAGGQEPAAWREWTNFQKLSQADQIRYLALKRQEQVKDVGGGYGVYNPVTGGMTQVPGGKKGLTPAQQADEERKSREAEYKFRNDQNLLNDALNVNQKQISAIDSLFNSDGTLNKAVARNFGMLQITNKFSGSEATNAKVVLKRLNADAFIVKLGEMKNQSQTGASGLGSLAVSEGNKVQEAAASLQGEQSAESFAKNVRLYQKELKDANDRLIKGFKNTYQNKDGQQYEQQNKLLQTPPGIGNTPVGDLPPAPGGTPTPGGTQTPANAAGGTQKFMVPY